MKKETYTKKTYGYCKCSPLDVIVRFENSNLTSFKWGHRYTFLNDTEKSTNIFRCSKCKEVIHDNFVIKSFCPKCDGKRWYFVNEWIGSLQGRKDCKCKGQTVL